MIPSNRPIKMISAALMALAILIPNTALASGCTSSSQNDPCYENNDDILAGTRTVMPVDDLFVSLTKYDGKDTDPSSIKNWNYVLNTEELAVKSVSKSQNNTPCVPTFQNKLQSKIGRIFSLDHDVIANMRLSNDCSKLELHILDKKDSSNDSVRTLFNGGANDNIGYAGITMADFNKDGYDDIFTIIDSQLQIFTAACTGDPFGECADAPSAGLHPGPAFFVNGGTGPYAGAPVAGDFDGDGYMDIAIPMFIDSTGEVVIEIASVCPSAGTVINDGTCSNAFQITNFRRIDLGVKLNLPSKSLSRPTLNIGAGNFDGLVDKTTGIADDELVVALANQDNSSVTVTVYDYDTVAKVMVPKYAMPAFDIENNGDHGAQVFIEGALLDATTLQAQAVLAWTEKGGSVEHRGVVSVISFDSDLTMHRKSTVLANNSKTRIFGMAVGRFDPPTDSHIDLNQQISLLISHDNTDTQIQFFTALDVNDTYTPEEVTDSRINIDYDLYIDGSMQLSPLAAGDLQGRSLTLGTPDIITISSTQASIIIGLPPMHVDFIELKPGGEPSIFNVSVYPETFNAGFDFDIESGDTNSQEGSTGFGVALKGSVKFTNTYGTKSDGYSQSIKYAGEAEYNRTVTHTYDSYSGYSYSLVADTLFDDILIASSRRTNIYSYPIIGQFACPDEHENCDLTCTYGDEGCYKQPLMLQFSGPDNIVYTTPAKAGGMEWYQPVTEPGNIFSYPGSLAMLKVNQALSGANSEINLLSSSSSVWDSQSPETVTIGWESSEGKSKTINQSEQMSGSIEYTYKAQAGLKGVTGAKSKGQIALEGSVALETMNTMSHDWSKNAGITLERGLGTGGDASDDNLLYQGATYIYGLKASTGTISPALGAEANLSNIATYGPIIVGHVANVVSQGLTISGEWWKQAYATAPDIALNHPQRWLQKLHEGSDPQRVKFNCPIGYESDFESPEEDPGSCVPNEDEPNTANIAAAAFYKMKGLFVTSGDSLEGPPSTLATLGDELTLQARVYNYSLAPMPEGATVHARFYAQPWDGQNGTFTDGEGSYGFADALFIGEQALDTPIPAYCGGSASYDTCMDATTPNYLMASVKWDTSTIAPQPSEDTNWKFWVVVWMQDENGKLLEELDSHGLGSIPPSDISSLANIRVETYSNNIGFYNQVFALLLPSASTANTSSSKITEEKESLVIETMEPEGGYLKRHVQSMVRVHYRASGRHYDDVKVLLYEGNSSKGQLLDMDLIPRMSRGEASVVAFPYVPTTCGAHSLFVETFQSDGNKPITETLSFDVPCKPSKITNFKGIATTTGASSLHLSGEFTLHRANSLPGIDLTDSDAKVTLYHLLDEVDKNGELVRGLPLVLTASSTTTDGFTLYKTPEGTSPVATVKLKKLDAPGAYTFILTVKNTSISKSESCPTTELFTRFTIEDSGTKPVHVVTNATWDCRNFSGNELTTGDTFPDGYIVVTKSSNGDALSNIGMLLMLLLTAMTGLYFIRKEENRDTL